MTDAKERPIIFSAGMIRAIIAGRKTQTRRILKPQPKPFRLNQDDPAFGLLKGDWCPVELQHDEPWPRVSWRVITKQQVRFAAGLRLWVRETWADVNTESGPALLYRADGNYRWCESDAYPVEYERYPGCIFATWGADLLRGADGRWRSPIHMPRWASRLTLTVTAVKVERLQDITKEDAIAEGALEASNEARVAFSLLWDSIHGKQSWEENPYVVAISFTAKTPAAPDS